MKKILFAIAVIGGLLSSCNPSKTNAKYLDEAVELTAIEIFSDSPYRASRTRTIDIVHTDLKVSFDWTKQYLYGNATLTLKPYFYKTDQVVLDAKGQEILEVSLLNGTLKKSLTYIYENDVLTIQLDRNYGNSELIKVFIDYVAKPEERITNKGHAVADDKGLYFINPLNEDIGKPQQVWTQGETQASSVWFPTIDSPNERSTHQISMTVNEKFVTISNGNLVSSTVNGNGTRTDTWVQNKPIAPYLFMMAVSEYAVVKDSLNGMQVNYYVDPGYENDAQEIFKNTTEMISFYSEILGYDYPWSKYSQVIAHDYVSGAMENVGAVIFGDFVQQSHQEMIDGDNEETVAHELFHQWFGDLVTCESWSNLPLNESFATYGEYLWFEHKYGALRADEHLNSDLEKYLQEANSGSVHDLIRFKYHKADDMFDSHSYAKGGRILHMLRSYVGDEAFFATLKLYLHDNEFSSVEIHQLRLAFEKVTGEDLNWFFNQWFMGKGHPELDITYTYDSTTSVQHIVVDQLQNVDEYAMFRLPVDIDIYIGSVKQTYHVIVDSVSKTFSFNVSAKPDLVNFDARKILVCTKSENHTMAEMKFMYQNAPLFKDKHEALLFAYTEENDVDMAKGLILDAMMDEYSGIRSLAVSFYDKFNEIEDLKLRDVLVSSLQNDQSSSVRAEAAVALYDYYTWDEEMVNIFVNQITADSSYMVISELIRGIAISDSTLGFKYANRFENTDNLEVKLSCAEVYSVYGNNSNSDFFIELYPYSEGYFVMSYLDYYKDYLMLIDDVEAQNNALSIFEKEAKNEMGWFVKYYAVSGLVDLRAYYEARSNRYNKSGNVEKATSYATLVKRVDDFLTALRISEKDYRVFMKR
jgi:aminopeptidase N